MNTRIVILFIVFLIFRTQFSHIYSQQVEKMDTAKNEFSLSYGLFSVQEIAEAFGEAFLSILTFTSTDTKVTGPEGPIAFTYKRKLGDKFSIGLAGLYASFNTEARKANDNSVLWTTTNQYFALISTFDFYYVTSEWVRLYSGVSIGVVSSNQSIKYSYGPQTQYIYDTSPAYQLNLISLRVGKKFGGYLELGWGVSGVYNFGISYGF